MNLKEELLLHLKDEYECMEKDVQSMTDAINEDDFKKAYDWVRAVIEHALNMEDRMMAYKRRNAEEEH